MMGKQLRGKNGQYAGSIGEGKTPPLPNEVASPADEPSPLARNVSREAFYEYQAAGNPDTTYWQYLQLVMKEEKANPSTVPSTYTFIAQEDCELGGVYRLKSRNLRVGVYDGNGGFIGIREKFGDLYLFTEYHFDTGPPHGTVRPTEKLDVSTDGLPIVERFTPACRDCGEEVEFERGETGRGWFHTDGSDEHKAVSVGRPNTVLFTSCRSSKMSDR